MGGQDGHLSTQFFIIQSHGFQTHKYPIIYLFAHQYFDCFLRRCGVWKMSGQGGHLTIQFSMIQRLQKSHGCQTHKYPIIHLFAHPYFDCFLHHCGV